VGFCWSRLGKPNSRGGRERSGSRHAVMARAPGESPHDDPVRSTGHSAGGASADDTVSDLHRRGPRGRQNSLRHRGRPGDAELLREPPGFGRPRVRRPSGAEVNATRELSNGPGTMSRSIRSPATNARARSVWRSLPEHQGGDRLPFPPSGQPRLTRSCSPAYACGFARFRDRRRPAVGEPRRFFGPSIPDGTRDNRRAP
jgi:hypothetical protein